MEDPNEEVLELLNGGNRRNTMWGPRIWHLAFESFLDKYMTCGRYVDIKLKRETSTCDRIVSYWFLWCTHFKYEPSNSRQQMSPPPTILHFYPSTSLSLHFYRTIVLVSCIESLYRYTNLFSLS
jgi:hypothetical protein